MIRWYDIHGNRYMYHRIIRHPNRKNPPRHDHHNGIRTMRRLKILPSKGRYPRNRHDCLPKRRYYPIQSRWYGRICINSIIVIRLGSMSHVWSLPGIKIRTHHCTCNRNCFVIWPGRQIVLGVYCLDLIMRVIYWTDVIDWSIPSFHLWWMENVPNHGFNRHCFP